MNGIDFLADTNILLYILEGRGAVKPFLNEHANHRFNSAGFLLPSRMV
jgi:hypothetical protein